jgi:hypothetical protein
MREEALRVQRQLSNEEFHDLYVLSNLSYVIPYLLERYVTAIWILNSDITVTGFYGYNRSRSVLGIDIIYMYIYVCVCDKPNCN